MVKFPGNKGKSKAKKSRDVEASPLMADDEPASSSSSRLKKDREREAKRKKRDEQRAERDKRLADKDEKEYKSRSKKKSKPKLSQEEQDAKDANLGCCHEFGRILVKIIHLIDGAIGLTFVIYGAMIHGFEDPAMEAVITCLTFGSVMLFTSIMGAVGFYFTVCNRCGLVLSAYSAPLIAFAYLVVIISLMASPEKFFDYLTEHKDVLYLDDAEILTLQNILPVFYIILASLAGVEIFR